LSKPKARGVALIQYLVRFAPSPLGDEAVGAEWSDYSAARPSYKYYRQTLL